MGDKESDVQRALMDTLKSEFPGIYVRKIHQTMYSHSGIPDLVGCVNGKFFAIEVKTLTGKTSKLQNMELDAIIKAGGTALVCHGKKEIDDVIRILNITAV